jgi:spore coat polysaccharide biosynthesis protein SpsF
MDTNRGVVAIVQARMGSTRLPGKVLKPLRGKTVLEWVLERARQTSRLTDVLVATSHLPEDDVIAREAERLETNLVRGDAPDVLSRYSLAVREHRPEHIVRLTADCPCIDPDVVDRLVAMHLNCGADYTSNTHPRSFAHGLDVEVVSSDALLAADREAKEPEEREHVLPFIWKRPARFRLVNLEAPKNERAPGLRITLDTDEDYLMLLALFDHLPESFRVADILSVVSAHPWLTEINPQER